MQPVLLVIALNVLSSAVDSTNHHQLSVVKEWRYVNFTWDDQRSYEEAVRTGRYVKENVLIAGINYYNDYYYLTLPRMRFGNPVTLGRIRVDSSPRPLIEPFPSWSANELNNCDAMQNVQNVAIDANAKLWAIDGGKTNTLERNAFVKCDPKLVVIDLRTGEIVDRYVFPPDVASKEKSFLYDLVVDEDFAYITDNSRTDPGLIVYSRSKRSSWRVEHESMRADPGAVEFAVNGTVIRSPINVAGIALGTKMHVDERNITLNEDREIFYSPISSVDLFAISTSRLKVFPFTGIVRTIKNKGGQSDGMKMDNRGVLYYGVLPDNAIMRWDLRAANSSPKPIAVDRTFIQWTNAFAFDDSGNVLTLISTLQEYVRSTMDVRNVNFRILKGFVDARSYVYAEDTLVYSVHETENQSISPSTVDNRTETFLRFNPLEGTTTKAPEMEEPRWRTEATLTTTTTTTTTTTINMERAKNVEENEVVVKKAPEASSDVEKLRAVDLLSILCFVAALGLFK